MARDLKMQVILEAKDRVLGPLKKITQGSGKTAEAIRASKEQLRGLNQQQKDVSAYTKARWAMRSNQRAIEDVTHKQRQYADALGEQREAHVNIKSSLTVARREYDKLAKQVAQATEPNQQLNGELEKARIRLLSQQEAFDKSGRSIKKYRDRSRHAEDQVKQLSRAQEGHKDRLAAIKGRLDEAGVSTDNMSRAARELREQEERLNRTLERQKRRLERIKDVRQRLSKIGARGAGVVNNGRALATGAGMAGGVATAAVGGLSHNFASQGEEVRQWAARLGLGADELSRLQYAGRQFGVQSDAMIDALKEVSLRTDEFAETGKGAGAEAFERLGLAPEQLKAVSDDTGALFDLVMSRVREVKNVAARQRIVDELFGGQGGEQLAEMAGASADEIRRLLRESDALGVTLGKQDTEAAKGYMRAWRGAKGALMGVRNTLGRELAPELERLFGQFSTWVKENRDQVEQFAKDFRSGLRDVLPLIVDTVKGLAEFARTSATITQRVAEMVGGFDNLAIIMATVFASKTIGSVVAMTAAIGGLAGGGKAMRGLGKAMKWVGQQAKGPLVGALKGIGNFLKGTWRHLASFARGLQAFGAILWAVGKGMMIGLLGALKATAIFLATNPIGWAIMAIAGAAYLIYKNWDWLGPWFADLWDTIKVKASAFWEWLKGVPSAVGDAISSYFMNWTLAGLMIQHWDAIKAGAGELWDWFKAAPGNAIDFITEMIGNWDLTAQLKEKWDAAISYLKNLPGQMWQAGKDTASGLAQGISDGAGSLWSTVKGAVGVTEDAAREKLETHSPSRVFSAIGKDVMDGLQVGIKGREGAPLAQVGKFSQRLKRAGAGLAIGAASLPAVADVPIDSRSPLSSGGGGDVHITTGDIHVHASPGMDEQALARYVRAEVQRALAEASRDAGARRRSALYDTD